MYVARRGLLAVVLVSALSCAVLAGSAMAAFPNFSDCPREGSGVTTCVDIQNRSGDLEIKGFDVPLGESLEIRGGLIPNPEEPSTPTFVPPAGTDGFFAAPVAVPGGLLGIEWIPGTSVLAITELAGEASDIHINTSTTSIVIPVKVRLVNLLLGMNCHIGTNSNPVILSLTTGTTNPPPPNSPISGQRGRIVVLSGSIAIIDNVNVANEFAVPSSSSCGLGLGLINSLVNLKLQLPSAAGNNSIVIHNDVALGPA